MSHIIDALKAIQKYHTTYQVGMLQTKAYRFLRDWTNLQLEKYEISANEWALIGLVHDNPKGIRPKTAADEIGVEAPFITAMMATFRERSLISETPDVNDSRAKLLTITAEGGLFVKKVEADLREQTKKLLKDISRKDIASYLIVLSGIVEKNKITYEESK